MKPARIVSDWKSLSSGRTQTGQSAGSRLSGGSAPCSNAGLDPTYGITAIPQLDEQRLVPPSISKQVFSEAGTSGILESKQLVQLQIRAAQARARFLVTR